MSPRIQVLSDLHLEVGDQYSSFKVPAVAPFLVLAGDIGRLRDYSGYLGFLTVQCRQFERVYLVLGNHEFYGISRREGLRLAASLEQEPGLQGRLSILNRTRAELPGFPDIVLLGCTLQSNIPASSREVVLARVKDFRCIEDWTIDDHNAKHRKDLAWLKDQIAKLRQEETKSDLSKQRRIVVITHHAPCVNESSRPDQVHNPWTCSFATELLDQDISPAHAALSQVQVWIFGHTHYSTSFTKAGVKFVSNQRGNAVGIPCAKLSGSQNCGPLHDFDVQKVLSL